GHGLRQHPAAVTARGGAGRSRRRAAPRRDQPPWGAATRAAAERGGAGRSRRRAAPRRDQPPWGAATRAAAERGGAVYCAAQPPSMFQATPRTLLAAGAHKNAA